MYIAVEGQAQAPEALKHKLAGHWSQRITQEHRPVYRYRSGLLSILSRRYRY